MNTCPYCGRDNEPGGQFCMDCGKPLTKTAAAKSAAGPQAAASPAPAPQPAAAAPPAAAANPPTRGVSGTGPRGVSGAVAGTRVYQPQAAPAAATPVPSSAPCPFCGEPVGGALPFCPSCGRRLKAPGSGPACARCASPLASGSKFCATCGAPIGDTPGLFRPSSAPERRTDLAFTVTLLDEGGAAMQQFPRKAVVTTIGREDGDLRFPDDTFMSPLHTKLAWEGDQLVIRDLGSRNGTWVFLTEPRRLADGDLLLIGSQVMRFRRLGYPGPHAPEADATKRMGSLIPSADIASLTQLRSDGSARDVIQLSPGRDVRIGRERGDWVFPYDPSMSGQHALVRSEDADFVIVDDKSRNGVALAARGGMTAGPGTRLLVGDKLLRIDFA